MQDEPFLQASEAAFSFLSRWSYVVPMAHTKGNISPLNHDIAAHGFSFRIALTHAIRATGYLCPDALHDRYQIEASGLWPCWGQFPILDSCPLSAGGFRT